MWDFPQYTSRQQGFSSLSQGFLEVAGAAARAGVGARTQVSKTALNIRCKLSLEYLQILVAAVENLGPND